MTDRAERIAAIVSSQPLADWLWDRYEELTVRVADERPEDAADARRLADLCELLSSLVPMIPGGDRP